MRIVPITSLATGRPSVELEGVDHGNPGVSLILIDAAPGRGPALHRHAYAEVFVVQEGTAAFFDGTRTHEVGAGNIVIVPAGEPHGFKNTGDGQLRQVAIHVADAFETEWLATPDAVDPSSEGD
jgi:mannose-6-phosphate isomerase-like protein (cupin superfamily)